MARGIIPALAALPHGRRRSRAAVLSPNAESENLGGERRHGAHQGKHGEGGLRAAQMWELRGSREGWANHFTPFDQGISVSPTLRIIYKSNYTAEELLDYFHIHMHLMRPHAQFTWSRPITRPNGVRTTSSSPTARPAAAFQHVLRPMEAAAARRKRLVPEA